MKLAAYRQGQVYTLEQVRSLTHQFKFILSRPSMHGLFFLYKQKSNNHLWIAGPFQGKDSNLFLFLGRQVLPKGLTTSFSKIIQRNLENDWKKLRESKEDIYLEGEFRSSVALNVWASSFFAFDNNSFGENLD